jgi:hypothetical protein
MPVQNVEITDKLFLFSEKLVLIKLTFWFIQKNIPIITIIKTPVSLAEVKYWQTQTFKVYS